MMYMCLYTLLMYVSSYKVYDVCVFILCLWCMFLFTLFMICVFKLCWCMCLHTRFMMYVSLYTVNKSCVLFMVYMCPVYDLSFIFSETLTMSCLCPQWLHADREGLHLVHEKGEHADLPLPVQDLPWGGGARWGQGRGQGSRFNGLLHLRLRLWFSLALRIPSLCVKSWSWEMGLYFYNL